MPTPFLPTRAFQAYQIFAANTNVGKTIFATGLCRAAAIVAKESNRDVFYLKPVQTGYPVDSDERHVKTFNASPLLKTNTLYAYPDPVSPHIATDKPPHDKQVLDRVKQQMLDYVRQQKKNGSYFFLETAGGIHSPVMSGTPQVDFYRDLRLPTILVGDSNLGGISTTLTSLESLHVRGYDVPTILLFDQPRYRNHILIDKQAQKINQALVATIPPPPAMLQDPELEKASMEKYYTEVDEYLVPIIKELDIRHQERFDRLETMAQKSKDIFWWPFTQHEIVKDVTVIDSAHQDYFTTYKAGAPQDMFDSCASWWTQGLGHANPELTLAAAHAAGRYGHVIFPESTNEPALGLAEKVLEKDTWASRVFFSDNGSTAMEVALKMAMSATAKRYDFSIKEPVEVLGIDGSYHGDTIGAMDACPPNVYNEQVQWYEPKGHWLKPPSVHISHGQAYVRLPAEIASHHHDKSTKVVYDSINSIYSIHDSLQLNTTQATLAETYKQYIRQELKTLKAQKRRIGSLLMEPVLMGAGGMIFVDPLFQRTLIDVVRQEGSQLLYGMDRKEEGKEGWQGLPVIFDEVFAGWYRLGRRSASEFLGAKPDIVAYAKTLTGGLLPLALTVTKESIYNVFLSENKPDCLLHGHSYTAHPMGCSVAKKSIESLDQLNNSGWTPFRQDWKAHSIWSMWSPEVVDRLSRLNNVESVMTLGSVLAIELKDDQSKGYSSSVSKSIIQHLRSGAFKNGFDGTEETGVNLFARPLGNVVYLMTSQVTTQERVRECELALLNTLEKQV